MFKQKKENNEILSEPKDILNETENFYKNLWGSVEIENEQNAYLNCLDQIKLDQEHLNETNKLINEQEIERAIDSLNSNTAPGLDGLMV